MAYTFPMANKAVFSVHLFEDEYGRVTIKSDYIGEGFTALMMGIDIMNDLAMAADEHSEAIRLEPMVMTMPGIVQ